MKSESLSTLFIDRELGELSPEAVELFDAWLAEHPQAAAVGPSVRRTLVTTRAAVRLFPELARPEPNLTPPQEEPFAIRLQSGPRFRWMPLAMSASIIVLLSASAWLGFLAGEGSAQRAAKQSEPASPALHTRTVKPVGPWARYGLTTDPHGGLTLIRRDNNN
jgi:hypothetical protein